MTGKLAAIVMAAAALLMTPVLALGDTLILKDGTTYEGIVKSEGEDYIFFVVQTGSYKAPPKMFMKQDIKELVRDGAVTEAPSFNTDAPKRAGEPVRVDQPADIPPGAVKITFITLGDQKAGRDMVGPYINGDAITESADVLRDLPKAERPDIVVLVVDSGGGAVAAIEGIMESIDDMKKDFRVVAWIRSAISGAAFTAMNVEEIYFMTSGHLGGNVAFSSNGRSAKAMDGRGLNWILEIGEKVSRNGRLDIGIMKAMQIFGELTADIDENGDVTWYWYEEDDEALDDDDRLRGQHMVSPKDMILTFNSVDALRFKVSRGTADTKQELAELMGATEWVEVGHDAEERQVELRNKTARAESRLQIEYNKFQIALKFANSARDVKERGAKVAQARRHLRAMRRMVKEVPWWFETIRGLDDDFFREHERILDDLARG